MSLEKIQKDTAYEWYSLQMKFDYIDQHQFEIMPLLMKYHHYDDFPHCDENLSFIISLKNRKTKWKNYIIQISQ